MPDVIPLWFAVPAIIILWGLLAWHLVTHYHRRRAYRQHLERMANLDGWRATLNDWD